ncbi:MAG: OsmC family protein [Clostridia bacterium]|nr:OsmC family protein [Clostridia bacterium]
MKFKINAKSNGNMKTEVKARNFNIIVDEPESLGGSNEGATPTELVLASLAGCYTVVGNVVAREMGFNLKGLDIEIEGEMNPARFAGKSRDERAGFQSIDIIIKADSDADSKTLKEWVASIEDRCPVTDNLTNETPLNIRLS